MASAFNKDRQPFYNKQGHEDQIGVCPLLEIVRQMKGYGLGYKGISFQRNLYYVSLLCFYLNLI